jgi:hypothetical protein
MKTMLKVTFLFALVAFANTLFAAGNLKVNIVPVKAEKAVIAISKLSDSNFDITIADENGQIVYYKENSNPSENYRKVYDFSDLEDGTYYLTVASNDLTTERQFSLSHGKITVGEEKTTLEPFFGYQAGILKCSYLNFEKDKVTLTFYRNNEQIYSKEIGRDFNIHHALNLSKLDKGDYHAVLYAGGKQFEYPIEIQ